ncbi:MAG: hypothetical protein A3B44_03685 [Candidatus Levybacteria bacterium RIFCSPLOWO2_01_FULL_38_21]|nr:MAG: hypothetical protein A3B44_03685 [Candidatus Levybacteria bacterium RIFCSPLOWO2_01_FULL_38_21]
MKRLIYFFSFLVIILILLTVLPTPKVFGAKRPIYYGQETIKWTRIPNVAYYKIYYKESGSTNWQHAVNGVPNTLTALTIDYLKMWVWYQYNVVTVDDSGREYWSSGAKKFTPTIRTQTIR